MFAFRNSYKPQFYYYCYYKWNDSGGIIAAKDCKAEMEPGQSKWPLTRPKPDTLTNDPCLLVDPDYLVLLKPSMSTITGRPTRHGLILPVAVFKFIFNLFLWLEMMMMTTMTTRTHRWKRKQNLVKKLGLMTSTHDPYTRPGTNCWPGDPVPSLLQGHPTKHESKTKRFAVQFTVKSNW